MLYLASAALQLIYDGAALILETWSNRSWRRFKEHRRLQEQTAEEAMTMKSSTGNSFYHQEDANRVLANEGMASSFGLKPDAVPVKLTSSEESASRPTYPEFVEEGESQTNSDQTTISW